MATATPSTATPRPRRRRRLGRILLGLLAVLVLAVLAAGLWLRHRVAASLPPLRGELAVAGLTAPISIERDALGVPTVRAATRVDAARGLGFAHAQDRFFQMDMLRREGSGEFAELLGPVMVKHDQNRRLHHFQSKAQRILAGLPADQRALLEAYAQGVNEGLASLPAKPFEYVLLRAEPRAWKPEDSILAIYAMFFTLNDWRALVDADLGVLHGQVPEALYSFLVPAGTEWDAPLEGPGIPTPPIPGPEVLDLRKGRPKTAALSRPWPSPPPDGIEMEEGMPAWLDGRRGGGDVYGRAGSNNWAVAGSHTADGHALVADDMHLGLGIPNTWYRASWTWRDPDGSERRSTGVTLAGAPALVVGSTGRIAWGFTNSFVDVNDLVDLELDPNDPEVYRTPAGPRRFEHTSERILVKGKPTETFDAVSTVWGPVVERDDKGRPKRALAWTADLPDGANFNVFDLEKARTVDEAVEIAHASGLPPQNFTVADSSGRIAWTIIGRVPRRTGWSGQWPASFADGTRGWNGVLASAEVPKVVDPPSGRIWTANNRTVGPEGMAKLGDGCYDLGPRAMQIRDRLMALDKATPRDMLAIQLDNRALFLARWRDLLLKTLTPEAIKADPKRGELRQVLLTNWTGRASIDSAAYRFVREFRDSMEQQVFESLTGLKPLETPWFYQPYRRFEGPLWRLITERPAHLLDPRYKSWDEQILAVADGELEKLRKIGPKLAERTWGEHNTVIAKHPLSFALPFLARWLDLPPRQIPGDLDMPRVTGATFGASERMVVSPGHEETGIFHMPGGESGNPLSPHYGDGHAAWVEGRPTPFLPGPPVDVFKLVPKG